MRLAHVCHYAHPSVRKPVLIIRLSCPADTVILVMRRRATFKRVQGCNGSYQDGERQIFPRQRTNKALALKRHLGLRVNSMRRAPPTVLCSWLLISLLEASKVAGRLNSNVTWNVNTGPGLSSYQLSVSVQLPSPAEDSCIAAVIGLFQLDRSVSLPHLPRGLLKCPDKCPPCFNCLLPAFTCGQFGNCNEYDGQCKCPPGWGGIDCLTPRSFSPFHSAGI